MKHVNITLPLNGDSDEWRIANADELPIPGELCKVKFVIDIDAYFLPDGMATKWVLKEKREGKHHELDADVLAWKPRPGFSNYHKLKIKPDE